eukprot:TRINITY_DN5415_c0_g1_i6.p1 TRINITY_DN5415_c0_g1~~TRINITY_DN5415_c0_g1_i6.p1  ORF type:complete len:174 (+),score=29.79 TRINITY_DN5415_c0_g1_i6:72-593(+)
MGGRTSRSFVEQKETESLPLSCAVTTDMLKTLLVCAKYDVEVQRELSEARVLEQQLKSWTCNASSPIYREMVEETLKDFDLKCFENHVKVNLVGVKEVLRSVLLSLEGELSTMKLEVVNALKGGFVFHFWEETLKVPRGAKTQGKDNAEISSTLHTGNFIKGSLNHSQIVRYQ